MPAPAGDAYCPSAIAVRANLLGPFSITVGTRTAGPWSRPPAKRLLELLLISPGRRTGRGAACEALFPHLGPAAAARELSKALSMARASLSALGEEAAGLIQADRAHVWANPGAPLEVDLDLQEERLRSALKAEPGLDRDNQLLLALADEGTLLEDEPVAEWAVRPRERLEWARQGARLALARDRARGMGRSQPEAVIDAWESCLSHDPTSEEAASALMRVYEARRRQVLAEATYKRCRTALEELGLRVSPALEEVHLATTSTVRSPVHPVERSGRPAAAPYREERRLVSVLFAEVTGPVGISRKLDPEDLRELVGGALAGVVAHVEAFGGTVTSVSGAGLVAVFGAPESHEDDPERALRAAFRAVSGAGDGDGGLSLRTGVETGQAVVGPIGGASTTHYGALGEVVGVAAALQSVARPASVLAGPGTRAATEGLFEWGRQRRWPSNLGRSPSSEPTSSAPRPARWARSAGGASPDGPVGGPAGRAGGSP